MSKRYCAVGDYGIEADFATEKECKDWIERMARDEADSKWNDTSYEEWLKYYKIEIFTQAELDAMPED